jgi:predicted enzyme related to lactoylglutathione lyase
VTAEIDASKTMGSSKVRSVVHLELHTGDLRQACAFYARLFECRFERVDLSCGSYLAMDLGGGVGGGIVECRARRPSWLPYFEVDEIGAATSRARGLGAGVLLEPREGPAGWRSVVTDPTGGEVALWQPRRGRPDATPG